LFRSVIAAMKRQAKPGEFRSNLHRGGSASLIKITPEERMTAIRAAKVMGLSVAGVDILRSTHGPLVMEVNSSPGLAGIEETTGKDVAGLIIQHTEKNAGPHLTRTKGKGYCWLQALGFGSSSPADCFRRGRASHRARCAPGHFSWE